MIQERHRIFIFLMLCAVAQGVLAQSYEPASWMAQLSDDCLVAHISLPATHDSGAIEGGEYLQTQSSTIREQLEQGIRGFDIRLNPISADELGVYHGEHFMQQTWSRDVFTVFVEFLAQHPTEMLFVSLKKENGDADSDTFAAVLGKCLNDKMFASRVVAEFSSGLRLGNCRGKIVFMHRDNYLKEYPGGICHGFADNATFVCDLVADNGTVVKAQVEDEYEYESGKQAKYKAKTVMRNIKHAIRSARRGGADPLWHLTFVSATSKAFMPHEFAEALNGRLARKLLKKKGGFGIVLYDFAGTPDGMLLTRAIIESNFTQ